MALRDIRSYSYEARKWIAHNVRIFAYLRGNDWTPTSAPETCGTKPRLKLQAETSVCPTSEDVYCKSKRTYPPPRTKRTSTQRLYIKERTPLRTLNQDIYDESDVPAVGVEAEVPEGNVYERREFTMAEPTPIVEPPVTSLFECLSGGTLHLDKAAKVMAAKMRAKTFNQAAHDEFVKSEIATKASLRFDDLNRLDRPDAPLLNALAARLMGELALSKQQKVARMIEITEKTTPSGQDRTLSLQNCAKIWTLDFPAPFAKIKLNELITQWEPRKRDNLHQQLTSLFRFILLRATNPLQTIQEYAVRVNKTSGRDVRLRTLPEEVEELLKNFAEDMLGFGHDELRPGTVNTLEESEFYLSLGKNRQERMEALDDLTRERHDWRPVLFKCLQLALRDVRGYEFDTVQKKWIPNNRQKRSVADLGDKIQASSQQASSQQPSSQEPEASSQEAQPHQTTQAPPKPPSKQPAKPQPQRVLPVRRRILFEDESP